MRAKRVLISGMGSELGSLVASLLEAEPWVGQLQGIDIDPPRRRLRRAEFHLIGPREHARVVETVSRFDPHIVIHLAVWGADARASTRHARHMTDAYAVSILGGAAACPSLEHVVVRSAAEIYGRGTQSPERPDESAPLRPTSDFGRMALRIEDTATALGRQLGIPVGLLRLAPVIGPHVPSPLGRLLRQPLVPYSLFTNPSFSVLRDSDAAVAFVSAAHQRLDQALNIVAPGSVSARKAIELGRHLPVPIVGPQWAFTRQFSHVTGAPIPDHVAEILTRGRLLNGAAARQVLDFTPANSTLDALDQLFTWPSVVHLKPGLNVSGAAGRPAKLSVA